MASKPLNKWLEDKNKNQIKFDWSRNEMDPVITEIDLMFPKKIKIGQWSKKNGQ